MAKLRGLESAKEMQTSIQTLAGQVAQSKATVQEAVAYLTQLEKKLAAQEADAVKNAQEQQAQAEQPEAFSQEQEPARSAEQPAQQEPTPVQAEIQKEENPVKEIQQVSPAPSAPQAEKAPEAAPKDVPVKPQPVKAEPARQEPKAEPVKTEAPKTPAAQAPRQAPAGRDFLKANRPPMPKNPSAYAMRPPRPQGDRPARPAGDRPPRPQGDRPMGPRPAGDRPPRPQGDRPMGNRPPRPQGDRPMGARPAGQGRPARSSGPDLTPAVEKERVSNYDPNKSAYQRVYDVERKAPKAKKDVFKENIAKAGGLDDNARFRKQRSGKKAAAAPKVEAVKITHAVMSTEKITVKDLTEKLGKPAGEIIKRLFMLGIMATINNEIDYDTANLVAQEFGIELEYKPGKTFEETLSEEGDRLDDEAELVIRPPVVTIMGHVDHGKTSLLDKIRSTSVTKTEAGGITQHIGAYTVTCDGRQITFLDTPGHEAFTAMRARGAQATDIAILVVAADDGIMPQTIEAINHAKAANVPIIVAINKMDRPTANPDRIMQQLTEYELVPEEWGGSTIVAKVSALTGDGIDELLQMILLVADVNEYKANPDRKAKGIIIEAKLDKGRGPVSTVLVQNGTLRVGDTIVAGTAFGRVRAMIDDKGNRVEAAGPSMPVEVIGFNDVPNAGDILNAVEDERLSRQVAQERKDKIKAAQLKAMAKVTLDDLFSQISAGDIKELNIIIKADVQGSVEAVRQSMEKLSTQEVKVCPIHGGVGAINETDVMLASASNAIIIGFNVRPDAKARTIAEQEGVDIRLYRVIYNAIEDVQAAIKGLLAPKFRENILGHAQVRQTFRVSGVGTIAGSYVTDGVVRRNAQVRLLRDNVVVFEGKLSSLKRFKDDAREVASGYECGVGLENYNDVKDGDVVECFVMEEVE